MLRRAMSPVRAFSWLTLLFALLGAGCAPDIGDSCTTSVNCSANGERVCDFASPGGYCTVIGCDDTTCLEDAVCVEFRFEPERTALAFCMASCEDSGDCRDDEGYACLSAEEIVDDNGVPIARLYANQSGKFCAVAMSR